MTRFIIEKNERQNELFFRKFHEAPPVLALVLLLIAWEL
jgi:hypothetical protein